MTTIREKIAATPKGMVLLRNGETITEAEYEKAKAERRREGAKVAAKSRARNKLFFQYSERFGWKYLNVTLTAAVMKKVEKSLATGIDLFAEVKSKTAEQEERERPERERREAKPSRQRWLVEPRSTSRCSRRSPMRKRRPTPASSKIASSMRARVIVVAGILCIPRRVRALHRAADRRRPRVCRSVD